MLENINKVHIVGIGGISMSAIARVLLNRGIACTGSDAHPNDNTQQMEALGIPVFIGHDAGNITDQQLLIYTAAVSEDIPEIVEAHKRGIAVMSRASFLGLLMAQYHNSIAVAGSHGKTTVTSMISHVLADRVDPTVVVGGMLHDNHSNVIIGGSDYFIHEACEFKDTFLSLYPKYSVILNIDEDHMEYFHSLDRIIESFGQFSAQTSEVVFYNADDANSVEATSEYYGRTVSFGYSEYADYRIANLVCGNDALAKFDIVHKGKTLAHIEMHAEGVINAINAAATFAVCHEILGDPAYIARKIGDFRNTDRRFQVYGTFQGITLVDDFAHHPEEIKYALDTAKRVAKGRVIALFQPYTFSRTELLLHEFSECFDQADLVVVSDILGGREVDPGTIHSKDLVRELEKHGKEAHYAPGELGEVARYAISIAKKEEPGDMIITLGCGNVYLATRAMQKQLTE